MSEQNRRFMYEKLVKENRLSQDDGALIKEFGKPSEPIKPKVKKVVRK